MSKQRVRSDISYSQIREAFGNGSLARGKALLEAQALRLEHARTKHPPAECAGRGEVWGHERLRDEVQELLLAIKLEGRDRVVDEAMDVIAVAIRIINGEYE